MSRTRLKSSEASRNTGATRPTALLMVSEGWGKGLMEMLQGSAGSACARGVGCAWECDSLGHGSVGWAVQGAHAASMAPGERPGDLTFENHAGVLPLHCHLQPASQPSTDVKHARCMLAGACEHPLNPLIRKYLNHTGI